MSTLVRSVANLAHLGAMSTAKSLAFGRKSSHILSELPRSTPISNSTSGSLRTRSKYRK